MSDEIGVVALSPEEVRVLGSLIEKDFTTPDYYPLTLNALTLACNQTSNRDPVVSYGESTVVRALDRLRELRFAFMFCGAGSRVPRYGHKIGETLALGRDELSVLCVLMLRGPQTAGEIKTRCARMYDFASLEAAETFLDAFTQRTAQPPLVTKLPRAPGFKEPRYAHLLSGKPVLAAGDAGPAPEPATVAVRQEDERVAALEKSVAQLCDELAELRQQLSDFKKQFEA